MERVKKKSWTVLVFMNVELGLETAALRSVRAMKRVGSSSNLNVVVHLTNALGQSDRFLIEPRRERHLGSVPHRRTGRQSFARELGSFVTWGTRRFPARRTMLVLWGHAYGVRFGRDPGQTIRLIDLARALRRARHRRGGHLDIIGFNSCSMSYAEAAYELRKAVDYMVASQAAGWLVGWPLQAALAAMARNPRLEPARVGAGIVRRFVRSSRRRSTTMTMLDLRKCEGLSWAVRELTEAIRAVGRGGQVRRSVRDAFLEAASVERVRPLIDLTGLCTNLGVRSPSTAVRRAARRTANLLRKDPRGFVRAHGARPGVPGFHGVAIYAAQVTNRSDWRSLNMATDGYEDLALNRETGWHKLAGRLRDR
jgi:hypothetical protein